MAAADRAQLIAELVLDDKFTKPLGRIDKRLGAFSGAVNRNLGRGIDTAVTKIGRAVVDVSKGVVNAAIDWEEAFTGVTKTVDATPAQLDEISDSLRKMSTEMPNTALELAAIAEAGGAMGIASGDIEAFTRQVAILASTTDVSSDDAATALGQLQNVIGLTGDEFDNFTAALVELGNEGASTESAILEIAKRSGGAAKLIGIAKDATLGWASAAANLGLNEELAGTALQNFYLKSLNATQGGESLALMADIAGTSAKKFKKTFDKNATGALQDFLKGLGKMSKDKRLKVIQTLFGKGSGLSRLILGLTGDVDGLTSALDDSTTAWAEGTAAQEEFDKRNKTVRSSISRLQNTLTDAAVTVGEGIAPALGRAASKLAEFLKIPANREALKRIGEDIGRIIDDVDWNALIGYAKSFMGALDKASVFAKGLWDAFSAIPSDAKAVLLSLAGLNKLSGGAVTGIIGDAFKGIGDQFFARGSSPANPMWVQQLGTPGGVPVPTKPGLPSGVVKPAIGAAVIFPMAEFHKQTTLELQQKGILQGIETNTDKIPKPMIKGPPGGGRGVPNRPGGPGGGARTSDELKRAILGTKAATSQAGEDTTNAMGTVDASVIRNRDAIHQSKQAQVNAVQTGTLNVQNQTRSSGNGIAQTSITNANRIISGMKGIPPPIVNVDVDVSATTVRQTTTITNRVGSTGGSAANDERHYG